MGFLFRLPLLLFELLVRRLLGRDPEQERYAEAARSARPAPPPQPPGFSANGAPPPPTADEAIDRREAREAVEAEVELPEPTPLRPISEAQDAHVDAEPTLVESFGPAGDVGSTITVEEPWSGYATQPANAIVQRLRQADPATKAVVALYERGHKNRATVLKATG